MTGYKFGTICSLMPGTSRKNIVYELASNWLNSNNFDKISKVEAIKHGNKYEDICFTKYLDDITKKDNKLRKNLRKYPIMKKSGFVISE